jgi:hypothetical protein
MSDEKIEELYGIGSSPTMGHFGKLDNPFVGSGLDRNINGLERKTANIHQCGRYPLSVWQKDMFTNIIRGNDILVSVPPASGKTLPLLCAYKQILLDFLIQKANNPNLNIEVPRIAVISPTQQLTMQLADQDFLRNSENGLLRMVAQNPQVFKTLFFSGQFGGKTFDIHKPGNQPKFDPRTGNYIKIQGNDDSESTLTEPNLNELTQIEINEIYKIIKQEFLATLIGGGGNDSFTNFKLFQPLKPIIIGTYAPMAKMISQYGNKFKIIAIDEAQEYFRPGNKIITDDLHKKQTYFMDIIQKAPKESSLILMTGSTNDKSVNQIKDMINKHYNRKLIKIPDLLPSEITDPTKRKEMEGATENRSKINIMSFDRMQTPNELKNLVIDIVSKRQLNSLILIFSLKRATAGGIFRIIEDIINEKKLPIINREYILNTISDEQKRSMVDNLKNVIFYLNRTISKENDQNLLNVINYHKGKLERELNLLEVGTVEKVELIYNNILELEKSLRNKSNSSTEFNSTLNEINKFKSLIVSELTSTPIYNKDGVQIKIDNVSDFKKYMDTKDNKITLKHLSDRESQNYISKDAPFDADISVDDIEFLKYFDIDSLERKGEEKVILSRPDPNNLLYQAALRGIGVMVGGLHQRHKSTIQKLFKEGKLPLLFGTDALGVGANTDVKYLYIPQLKKIDESGSFGVVDQSSIVQIVNRAGRGQFKVASVYCSSTDYPEIKRLIQNDPRVSVGEVEPEITDNLSDIVKSKGLDFSMRRLYNILSGEN